MGSGASTLPDQLSEADVRNYAGDKFSESKYSELKNDGGFVSREAVLKHQNELDSNKKLQSHNSMPTTRLGPPSRENRVLYGCNVIINVIE